MTLSAKPWLVIQREMRTPIAASFSRPTQTPVSPSTRAAVDAEVGRRPNQHFFEIAHVAVDVAAIGLEIDDRIADELPGPVVGDVAAAAGLVDLDAARRERIRRREDVRAPAVAAHAERQDVRMLDEQQHVVDAIRRGAPRRARAAARAPRRTARGRDGGLRASDRAFGYSRDRDSHDLIATCRSGLASGPSSRACCLTCDMNSSATAPSMIRWS